MRLLDEFPFPVWRAGVDGKCDHFNKAWLDFTGRTLKQELGDGWASGVHPEDISACLRDYREAFRARVPFQLQYRLRRFDGEFHWVIDYGSPFNDDAGNFAGYIGACHDINERKRAEVEQRKLSSAVEQTADHVFITDRDGVIEYVNAAFEKSSGYTKEEVPGKTPRIVKSDKHGAEFYENLWQKILAGEVFRAEFINRKKNGELYYEEKTITPICDAMGNITHFVSTGRDITERKRAEQALRESEERFHTQYKSMPIPVFMWRAVNDDFVLLGGNDAAVAFTEAHLHTIVGRKASELYGDMPQIREDFARCFATRTVISRELPYLMRSSGEQKELIATYAFIPPDLVNLHVFDITKRKQVEEALNAASRQLRNLSRRRVRIQEDERKNLARELHDQIGQALTATKISVQAAKGSRKREKMVGQLDHAMAIIDDTLRQVRQMTLRLRPPALDDLGLIPALRLVLDDYGKRGQWDIEFSGDENLKRPDAEVEIACFRIAIEALTNVLRHAKAGKVSLELHETRDSLHLIVRDNGVGFDVADAEKRVELDRLGLVGMRERATAVGGKIEYKSVPGQGTEVHASLPLHPA